RLLHILRTALPVLGAAWTLTGQEAKADTERAAVPEAPTESPAATEVDPELFWSGGPLPAIAARAAEAEMPLLRRLGGFPFWRGQEPLQEALLPAYRRAAVRGMELAHGEEAPHPQKKREPPLRRLPFQNR